MTNINNIDRNNLMNNFTVFKYGVDIEDIIDQFSTPDIDEAIAIAEGDEYDEVVNNNTGEIVWTKEKEVVSMGNIYDIMVVGGTYHNDNGTDYTILAFSKEADIALLLNPQNNFTPYVGAKNVRFGSWGSGHYFKSIQEACDWYIDRCKDFE